MTSEEIAAIRRTFAVGQVLPAPPDPFAVVTRLCDALEAEQAAHRETKRELVNLRDWLGLAT